MAIDSHDIEAKIVDIFQRKLADALRDADNVALNEARQAWSGIGPAPTCPSVHDVMDRIKEALGKGHRTREQATLQLVKETLDLYGSVLSAELRESLVKIVEDAFPRDHYVKFAMNTEGVYKRNAPYQTGKFNKSTLDMGVACVHAASSNMAATEAAHISRKPPLGQTEAGVVHQSGFAVYNRRKVVDG